MKLLNGEVLGASQALEELSNKDFPIKVSYGLVTLINKLASQVTIIEKLRTDLIKKYGTEEKGGSISIAPNTPKMAKFMDEFGYGCLLGTGHDSRFEYWSCYNAT